ncbi:MAG TPA: hypothetical protein VE782_12825, partial [Myxococcaceae bacterium]|nr:hypothetical protein [Myxococcaceae bacterium]
GISRMLFPGVPNAKRFVALGFNNRSDVVGYMIQPDGTRRGFLLSPARSKSSRRSEAASAARTRSMTPGVRVAGDSTSSDGSYRSFLFEGGDESPRCARNQRQGADPLHGWAIGRAEIARIPAPAE